MENFVEMFKNFLVAVVIVEYNLKAMQAQEEEFLQEKGCQKGL